LKGAENGSWSAGTDTVLPDEVMVKHLQTIVALIEKREVTIEDMWAAARKFLRQHRMDNRKNVAYDAIRQKKPP